MFIYDPEHGFQIGPLAYLVLPFQLAVAAITPLAAAVVRRPRDRTPQRTVAAERQ